MSVIGWILIALAVVLLAVLVLPFGVKVEWLGSWRVTLLMFGVFPVYTVSPAPEKTTPSDTTAQGEKDLKKKPSLADEVRSLWQEEGIGGVLHFFRQLLTVATEALGGLVKCVRVRKLSLCIRVGGEESDEIATRYGQICAALFPTVTALSNVISMRKPCIHVIPEFTLSETQVRLRMLCWICPVGVVVVAMRTLIKGAVVWMKTVKVSSNSTVSSMSTK